MANNHSLTQADAETEVVETTLTMSHMEVQTPFLPPQYLEEYEKTVPGSAKQMFDMIVTQQEFNIELKRHEIDFNQKNLQRVIDVDHANLAEQKRASQIKSRGQVFSFILSLCLIGLAGWFAYLGHTFLAGTALTLITGVITVLFLQKQHKEQDPPNNET